MKCYFKQTTYIYICVFVYVSVYDGFFVSVLSITSLRVYFLLRRVSPLQRSVFVNTVRRGRDVNTGSSLIFM